MDRRPLRLVYGLDVDGHNLCAAALQLEGPEAVEGADVQRPALHPLGQHPPGRGPQVDVPRSDQPGRQLDAVVPDRVRGDRRAQIGGGSHAGARG